ncbi:MAG: hypothetical protein ACPHID_09025 [Thermoplasmatota archaeon]
MDVLDAGVYVAKWEADVPKLQTVLWGPLQAKEMGFEGWEWQDGGETGFVAHNPHIRLPAGFATSTLIVQNRKRKAYLTIYFGGYPADVPEAHRRTDQQKVVSAVEAFLTRLAKQSVTLVLQGEVAMVDNVNDAAVEAPAPAPAAIPAPERGVWDV